MSNLLPNDEKQQVRREYSLRRQIMVLMLLGVIGIIAIIALFPSYVIVQQRFAEVKAELSDLEEEVDTSSSERITQRLQRTNTVLDILAPYSDHVPFYVYIRRLFEQTPHGVRVSGATYESNLKKDEDGNVQEEIVTVTITGIAQNRDTLTALKRDLESMDMIESVSLPVSSIAERENIEFNMEVTSTL